jgi:hypothetical protein
VLAPGRLLNILHKTATHNEEFSDLKCPYTESRLGKPAVDSPTSEREQKDVTENEN